MKGVCRGLPKLVLLSRSLSVHLKFSENMRMFHHVLSIPLHNLSVHQMIDSHLETKISYGVFFMIQS